MPQMIRMVTTAVHQYAGHRLFVGDEYDCEDQHVAHMEKLGWSRAVRADDQERPKTYNTRALVAADDRLKSRRK